MYCMYALIFLLFNISMVASYPHPPSPPPTPPPPVIPEASHGTWYRLFGPGRHPAQIQAAFVDDAMRIARVGTATVIQLYELGDRPGVLHLIGNVGGTAQLARLVGDWIRLPIKGEHPYSRHLTIGVRMDAEGRLTISQPTMLRIPSGLYLQNYHVPDGFWYRLPRLETTTHAIPEDHIDNVLELRNNHQKKYLWTLPRCRPNNNDFRLLKEITTEEDIDSLLGDWVRYPTKTTSRGARHQLARAQFRAGEFEMNFISF